MTRLNNHVLLTANTNATTTIFVACSTLLIALGVASIIGGSNHILYTTVNAQLVDAGELREELRASIADELQGKLNQNQSNQSAASAASPNELALSLDRAHYIPLSPLSDSPGNQVKMLLGYTIDDPSALAEDTVSAVMEVYAENQTLLRTSSLPEPIVLNDSEGTIQLATTFDDPTLQNITARALLTDGQKINPLSDPIEANLGLGELKTEGTVDLE